MASNTQKRDIANRALTILVGGKTTDGSMLFRTIDDTEFADWTTVDAANDPGKRLLCFAYETVLKQVIEDIAPEFAKSYEDLGQNFRVNKEFGGWEYLFELPTDYLALIVQLLEGRPDPENGFDCEVIDFSAYSHVVLGDDEQAYYCSTSHTSVDDTSDGQPPGDDGNGNWTLYSTNGGLGAAWAASVAYKNAATGKMLATNQLTNDAGTSAYIKYLAYVRAARSDQPANYPANFKNALATRLAAEMALHAKDYKRRTQLLTEYEVLAKPGYRQVQNRHRDRVKQLTVFEKRLV